MVTNGPVAILEARNVVGYTANVGEDIAGGDFTLTIRVRSSAEFGQVDRVRLYRGDLIDKSECVEKTFVPSNNEMTHLFTHKIAHRNRGYVRVEATSSVGSRRYKCLTNPIWLRSA